MAAAKGWSEFVRVGAFNSFVIISDDESLCSTRESRRPSRTLGQQIADPESFTLKDPALNAARFDDALLSLSPEQFGMRERRNYRVHSIVGVVANSEDKPWPPSAPLQTTLCDSADASGTDHQALSILTGGLRYPVCRHDNFDVVFHALAEDAIRAAQLVPIPCEPYSCFAGG